MNIVFRADASIDIGTGHVVRCLTLADALRDRGGANCRFVSRACDGHLIDRVRARGYDVLPLAEPDVPTCRSNVVERARPAHAAWLATDFDTDGRQTAEAIGIAPIDWLVVDHYALDASWESRLRARCRHLMVIDDLADRPHDCDLLLDQNLGRTVEDYAALVPQGCEVLAGPRYALLRPEFAELRERALSRREAPNLGQLLITMGGVDKDDVTSRVLRALRSVALPSDCRLIVVMGPSAPWLDTVRAVAHTLPWPTEVLVDVSDMARLMAEADLAIGAAGSTSWERCCLGLPSLLVVLADNQIRIADALEAFGASWTMRVDTLADDLRNFFSEGEAISLSLAGAARAARSVTEGDGASRVSQIMSGI